MKNDSTIYFKMVIDHLVREYVSTLQGTEKEAFLLPIPDRVQKYPNIPIEILREEQRNAFMMFASWILTRSFHPDPNSEK